MKKMYEPEKAMGQNRSHGVTEEDRTDLREHRCLVVR